MLIDDGIAARGNGLYLHTNGFTYNDMYRLTGILYYVFGFTVNLNHVAGQPIIYIPSAHMDRVRNMVMPYMHPSIMSKLV